MTLYFAGEEFKKNIFGYT